jgi:polyisoprenoid-binding protein YceI
MMTALSLAALAGFASPAQAEVESYGFDKAHTQIYFSVNHLGFSNSRGRFLNFDGTLQLDRAAPASSMVDVSIDTASIEMNDQAWNDHMKNADFFNVEKFPAMTFKSTSVEVTGENTANVTGDLTLLGVTKPVVMAVTHNKSDVHPYSGKMVAGFSATTNIKRSDFGMNYGLPAVGDDVAINIEVEAVRADAEVTNQ